MSEYICAVCDHKHSSHENLDGRCLVGDCGCTAFSTSLHKPAPASAGKEKLRHEPIDCPECGSMARLLGDMLSCFNCGFSKDMAPPPSSSGELVVGQKVMIEAEVTYIYKGYNGVRLVIRDPAVMDSVTFTAHPSSLIPLPPPPTTP